MTRVYLLRHGATAINREIPYRLQGRLIDPPLDDLGREQARLAAGVLCRLKLDAAYASPLLRSLETARIVASPHGFEPIVVDAIAEAHLGRWEGLTWDEARDRDPDLFDRFMAHPGTTPYPDGESFLEVQRRVSPAIADLASRHPGGRIAVVGHNVVNRAYLAGLLGLPIDAARGLKQSNCGINAIDFEGNRPILLSMNESFHLSISSI